MGSVRQHTVYDMGFARLFCGTMLASSALGAFLTTAIIRPKLNSSPCLVLLATDDEFLKLPYVSGEENEFVVKANEEHKAQFEAGSAVFGNSASVASDTNGAGAGAEWKEEDFVAMSVGKGNAGPSEKFLGPNGHMVYQTKRPILSEKECQYWIQMARDAISQGRFPENINSQVSNARSMDKPLTNSELNEGIQVFG